MSTWERSLSWLERVGDWANPILVKETRQALKSRQFVVTFMLMLAISWFIFAIGVIGNSSALEYGAIGSAFFFGFWIVLAIAVTVLVPFSAQRSLLAERDQATYDLLSITTLTPRQIVWGKLLSALVQALIFYSAIAPFIAFTSLLQGFDFFYVVSILVLTMLVSMFISMAAIASSTTVKHRQWQSFAMIGGLATIVFLAWMLLMLVYQVLDDFDPTDSEHWIGLTFTVVMGASYFVLFQRIATAQLTFESDDRSSGIRIICSVQFFLVWIGLLSFGWFVGGTGIDEELIILATILSAIHLAVVGLFAVTEESFLSRRVRRNLPRSSFRRLIHVPFLQGGARGYLYLVIHVALFAVVSGWCSYMFIVGSRDWTLAVPLVISCYLVIYLGIACALARWLNQLSSDIKPGHARVLMTILIAIGSIAPHIPKLWMNMFAYQYSLLQLSDPFSTIIEVADNGVYTGTILIFLAAGALAALLLNARAIKDGICEVVFAEVPQSRSEIAATVPAEAEPAAG